MWIVICWDDEHDVAATYGPFDAKLIAQRFADFLTAEVNPATVEALWSPVNEVLNWREVTKAQAEASTDGS